MKKFENPMLIENERLLSCWMSPAYVDARGSGTPLKGQNKIEHKFLRKVHDNQSLIRMLKHHVAAWKLESTEQQGIIRYVVTAFSEKQKPLRVIEIDYERINESGCQSIKFLSYRLFHWPGAQLKEFLKRAKEAQA